VLAKFFNLRYAKYKLLASDDWSEEEKKLLKQVSLKVHRYDGMFMDSGSRHYISVGLSAIRCIENALKKSRKINSIRSILDFPCGYGRVLRFLKAKFPGANITGGEINLKMLRFCSHEFGIDTMVSDVSFDKLSINHKFDLIWCGSLITHIDEESIRNLLKFFHRHLLPDGLCVMTTHGSFTADRIQAKEFDYGLTATEQKTLLSQYQETGFGYTGQELTPGDGISIVSPDRFELIVDSVVPWVEIDYEHRGWDNHQDVYVFSVKQIL
jgi:SAM-dependent methyltransferase